MIKIKLEKADALFLENLLAVRYKTAISKLDNAGPSIEKAKAGCECDYLYSLIKKIKGGK